MKDILKCLLPELLALSGFQSALHTLLLYRLTLSGMYSVDLSVLGRVVFPFLYKQNAKITVEFGRKTHVAER